MLYQKGKEMKDLKLNLLKNEIEKNIFTIKSIDSAFSYNASFDLFKLFIDVVMNSEDNEILIISNIIKSFSDFILLQGWKKENFSYRFTIRFKDECTEINFEILETK